MVLVDINAEEAGMLARLCAQERDRVGRSVHQEDLAAQLHRTMTMVLKVFQAQQDITLLEKSLELNLRNLRREDTPVDHHHECACPVVDGTS